MQHRFARKLAVRAARFATLLVILCAASGARAQAKPRSSIPLRPSATSKARRARAPAKRDSAGRPPVRAGPTGGIDMVAIEHSCQQMAGAPVRPPPAFDN